MKKNNVIQKIVKTSYGLTHTKYIYQIYMYTISSKQQTRKHKFIQYTTSCSWYKQKSAKELTYDSDVQNICNRTQIHVHNVHLDKKIHCMFK